MPLSTPRRRKIAKKLLSDIDWAEGWTPEKSDRKRHALVFICPACDDEDDPPVCLKSRIAIALWDGEDWMEWTEPEMYKGPVYDVVGWSWLP
jgi:hypothetical protein